MTHAHAAQRSATHATRAMPRAAQAQHTAHSAHSAHSRGCGVLVRAQHEGQVGQLAHLALDRVPREGPGARRAHAAARTTARERHREQYARGPPKSHTPLALAVPSRQWQPCHPTLLVCGPPHPGAAGSQRQHHRHRGPPTPQDGAHAHTQGRHPLVAGGLLPAGPLPQPDGQRQLVAEAAPRGCDGLIQPGNTCLQPWQQHASHERAQRGRCRGEVVGGEAGAEAVGGRRWAGLGGLSCRPGWGGVGGARVYVCRA